MGPSRGEGRGRKMGEVKEPCLGAECKLNKGIAVTCSDLTYSPSSLPLRQATGMRPLAVPRAVRHLVPRPALACGMPPPAMPLRATLHLPPQGRGTAGMKLRDGGRPREQTEVRSYTTMQSDWLVQDLFSPIKSISSRSPRPGYIFLRKSK